MNTEIYYNHDLQEYRYRNAAPVVKRCEWTDNGVRCEDNAHPACEHGRCLMHAIAGWREALAEAIADDDVRSMTECSLAILRLERMMA